MNKRAPLVCQHLEHLNRAVLEELQGKELELLIGGKGGLRTKVRVLVNQRTNGVELAKYIDRCEGYSFELFIKARLSRPVLAEMKKSGSMASFTNRQRPPVLQRWDTLVTDGNSGNSSEHLGIGYA
jgi:hypothetical protein